MTKYQKLKQDYDQSGMSQKAFSKSKGMSASTVCNWLRKANETETASQFIPIHIAKPSSQVIRIVTTSGTVIELPA